MRVQEGQGRLERIEGYTTREPSCAAGCLHRNQLLQGASRSKLLTGCMGKSATCGRPRAASTMLSRALSLGSSRPGLSRLQGWDAEHRA